MECGNATDSWFLCQQSYTRGSRAVQPGRALPGGYCRRVIESIGGIDVSTQTNEQLFHRLTEESQASSSPNAGENTLPTFQTIVFRPIIVSPATRAANAASHARSQGKTQISSELTVNP